MDEVTARKMVSRCSICEVEGSVLTRHSMTTELPECPEGWESLWTGFTYQSISNPSVLPLSSPDSCLSTVQGRSSYVTCSAESRSCDLSNSDVDGDFLLAMDRREFPLGADDVAVTNDREALTKLSRCNVCMK